MSFVALSSRRLAGQEDFGWRISPERINIPAGEDRRLQVLDDSAQELRGAIWSVDDARLADIHEEGGRAVLHGKAAGTVRVSAALGGGKRVRDIQIWPQDQSMPAGTSRWGMHPIGREIGDIAAVPTPDGVNVFSLEQTPSGSTFLRGVEEDGIQAWSWLMPESTRDVELVCGDWLGGALISANRGSSFALYTVGQDGLLRWQHTLAGFRKGHAYSLEHLVHILSQSPDGKVTTITGIDAETGGQRFELTIPPSQQRRLNVRNSGSKIVCAEQTEVSPVRTLVSQLFVNIDGWAYVAFAQNEETLQAAACTVGAAVDRGDLKTTREARLILWQIHPDGTFRSTVVEEAQGSGPLSQPVPVAYPTGGIIPDGLGGVLLSVRRSATGRQDSGDESVYRLDEAGKVVYRVPMPRYAGVLKDGMVLGEDDTGFATRGGILVAFNVRDGKEMWRWDSRTPRIEVVAALAGGGCAVQTPTALVQVDNATDSKELFQGHAMVDWRGNMYRKPN